MDVDVSINLPGSHDQASPSAAKKVRGDGRHAVRSKGRRFAFAGGGSRVALASDLVLESSQGVSSFTFTAAGNDGFGPVVQPQVTSRIATAVSIINILVKDAASEPGVSSCG